MRQVPSLLLCENQVGTLLLSAGTQNEKFTKMSAPFLPSCLVRCCCTYDSFLSKCHFLGKSLGCKWYFQYLASVGKIIKIHCLQYRYSEFFSLRDPEKKIFPCELCWFWRLFYVQSKIATVIKFVRLCLMQEYEMRNLWIISTHSLDMLFGWVLFIWIGNLEQISFSG